MLYLSLLAFYFFMFLIINIIKNKNYRIINYLILNFIFFIDIVAILTKKQHLDYSFIANVDFTVIKVIKNTFLIPTLISFILFLIFNILIIIFNKKIYSFINRKKLNSVYLIFVFFILNSLPNGFIITEIKNFKFLFEKRENNIEEIFEKLNIDKNGYVDIQKLKASPGKNIVIIYLESLEQNFLKRTIFPNIAPDIKKIESEYSLYKNYIQVPGTGWTLGALYSTMTGIPAQFGMQGNEIFQNITDSEVVSLGKILKKAGYNMRFIEGASLSFAGKGNFLKYQGYESFGNEELDLNYPRNSWGVRDHDIFEEAKKSYIELSKKEQPFNLTILTVDVHFPDGLPDERMKAYIGDKETGAEFTAKSTYYLIDDFLKFLKSQDNYKNTSIYILPDHLMMGSEEVSPAVKKLNLEERKLFLFTNEKNIKGYESLDKEITFYDIPRLILNGSNVETNAKFIKELIPDFDPKMQKNNYFKELGDLNLVLNKFNIVKDDIKIQRLDDEIYFYIGENFVEKFKINQLIPNNIKYYPIDNNYTIKGNFIIDKNKKIYKYDLDETNSSLILGVQLNERNEIEAFLASYDKNIFERKNSNNSIIKLWNYNLNQEDNFIKIKLSDFYKIFKVAKLKNEIIQTKNLDEIFNKIKKLNNKDIIIAISAQDEAASQYNVFKKDFDLFGLKDLDKKYRYSYLALFNSVGEIYLNEFSVEKITRKIMIDDDDFELTSAGFDKGNISEIKIKGINYSKQGRGLNIVIFDKKNNTIIDNFNVDTYEDSNLTIKR